MKICRLIISVLFGTLTYPIFVFAASIFGITFVLALACLILCFPKLFGTKESRVEYYVHFQVLVYPFVMPILMWKDYYKTGEFDI